MSKKICIDARFWGIKHTGIGRYVENLIDNLPSDPNIKIVLIVHPEQKDEPKLARFEKHYASLHPYSAFSQVEMWWLLLRIRPDLLHVPHFTIPVLWPGKIIVTIHDLIKHLSRGQDTTTHGPLFYWLKYYGYLIIVWLAVHRAGHILVPANYWKKELVRRYNLNAEKISVTYEGAYPCKVSPFKDQTNSYLLYVGNLYPHKSIPILIEAVEKLKINLKIVCARNVFENRLPKSSFVQYLGRVTDEELTNLYKNALCFVLPSKIEGFGLTGLEAMAAGCPVVAADASCLPEIYQDASLYFDPDNLNDLISKITLVKTDQTLRKKLIKKGLAQVKKYSWVKMASETWEIYQQESR